MRRAGLVMYQVVAGDERARAPAAVCFVYDHHTANVVRWPNRCQLLPQSLWQCGDALAGHKIAHWQIGLLPGESGGGDDHALQAILCVSQDRAQTVFGRQSLTRVANDGAIGAGYP